MKSSLHTHGWYLFGKKYYFAAFLLVLFSACFLLPTPSTSALTTVPTKMNFQGRLTDSSGNVKANGTYNMRLRLYTASTGGSPVWSEDRLVSASQGVTVTNGLFSIKLGDVTTLPASLFASGDLYLSVELPSPATATSSSPSWTEGAMTPRNQMATSAYAYNAETLDGLDSAALAQLGATNLFTGTNTINVGSTNAFDVQDGSSVSVLKVDTSASIVSIGTTDANGTIFVLDTKNTAGDPTGTNGASYYNSNTGKFRCYEAGAWKDCDTGGTIASGTTAQRTGSPTEGAQFYDTTIKQMLTYANGKWQADRSDTVIIAASNSTQAEKDAADFVADGNTVAAADGDQIQINVALTAGAGKKVVLLAGTYVIDATILIPNNTIMAGVGDGTLIELADLDATDNMIENSDTSTGTAVTIESLRIDGRSDLNTAGTQTAIKYTGVGGGSGSTARSGGMISKVNISRMRTQGIEFSNSHHNNVISNYARANGDRGYYISSSSFNTFSNNMAQGNTGGGYLWNGSNTNSVISSNTAQGNTGPGFAFSQTTKTAVSGNTLSGNTYGIFMATSATNNIISGNTVTNNTSAGIDIGSGSNGTTVSGNSVTTNASDGINVGSDNVSITGNTVSDNTSSGIYVTGDSNTVSGNVVSGNPQYGIMLNSSNTSTVTGNRVMNSGGTTENNGIHIFTSDGSNITGNTVSDTSATSNNYGILIANSTSDNTYLSNNSLGTSTVQDLGTGTIYANQVDASGNLINRGTNGLAVGGLSASSTLTVQGGYVGQALPTPATPTGATQGTAGTTSYSYAVTAFDGVGQTLPSTAVTITTGNATLNGTNFNRITWTRVSGAVGYRVYRTASAGTPATTGLIGSVAANATFQLDDTGLAATTAVPTANTTGGISLAGGLQGSSATLTGNLIANGGIDFVSYAPFARFSSNRIALGSNGNTYSGMDFTVRNDTAITSETSGFTYTRFGATNLGSNITTQRFNVFNAPSYTGAFTLTNAATVAIGGAATASGGAVITNNYSLWTQGGTVRMDTGAAGTVGQVIRGAASQTADLLHLQNNGGTVIAKIDAAGVVHGSQLVSTVSTGTAPLSVASTTKVTNLNADSLDGIDSTAFGQLSASNTWTGSSNLFSTGKLQVGSDGGTNGGVFNVRSDGSSYAATNNPTYDCGPYQYNGSTCYDGPTGNIPPACAPWEFDGGDGQCYEDMGPPTVINNYSCPSGGTLSGSTCYLTNLLNIETTTSRLFTVDSTTGVRVGAGTADSTGVVFILDTKNTSGDPTGVDGAMYYNSNSSKFRCYQGGVWADCLSGQYIPLTMLSSSHTDAQTIYFGNAAVGLDTTAGTRKIYFPKAGTIRAAKVWTYASTAGSGENWSMYVRKNNSTDTLIQTVGSATNERSWTNNSLSISIAAGDYVEIKGVHPTWATNPGGVAYSGYLYIE